MWQENGVGHKVELGSFRFQHVCDGSGIMCSGRRLGLSGDEHVLERHCAQNEIVTHHYDTFETISLTSSSYFIVVVYIYLRDNLSYILCK